MHLDLLFCRSLFVLLYFFFWPLCCLFFFDIRILITPLVFSNSSCNLHVFITSKWVETNLCRYFIVCLHMFGCWRFSYHEEMILFLFINLTTSNISIFRTKSTITNVIKKISITNSALGSFDLLLLITPLASSNLSCMNYCQ